MHQARAWKASHDKKSKDLDIAEEKIKTLEEKLATTTKDLEDTRVDLVVVTDQKERWIDAYMETPEFKELMEDHDALTHPISFKEGWDETKAILKAHLGIFEASAFPCPLVLQPSKAVISEASRLLKEGEFDDSEGSSSFEFDKSEATPQKKAPSPSSKSSSKEESEGASSRSSGETASSSRETASISGETVSISNEEPSRKKQKTVGTSREPKTTPSKGDA